MIVSNYPPNLAQYLDRHQCNINAMAAQLNTNCLGMQNALEPRTIPDAELKARTFYPLASERSRVIQASRYVEALRWMRMRADERRMRGALS